MIKLTVTKHGNTFEVDDKSQPGTPPAGHGTTIVEAVGWWLLNNQDSVGVSFDWSAVKEDVDRWREQHFEKNR